MSQGKIRSLQFVELAWYIFDVSCPGNNNACTILPPLARPRRVQQTRVTIQTGPVSDAVDGSEILGHLGWD